MREWADRHKTLVILGVRDLGELLNWEQILAHSRTRYEAFAEPDRNGEKTALAVHPSADGYLFRKLRLL